MKKHWIFCYLALAFFYCQWANANPYDISTSQFESTYQSLMAQKLAFDEQLTPQSWQYIRNKNMRHKLRLSKSERILVNDYLAWEEQWQALTPVAKFRDDLVSKYTEHTNTAPTDELRLEATEISLTLIRRTAVLRKEFNMSFIPVWQNFLINTHIRKRGFCYHWADALLETLIPIERKHFSVTWSESNPGTLSEHNVATIFPKGKEYKDGLFFDPWRTGGDPFWRSPINDKHFDWKRREEYGIY